MGSMIFRNIHDFKMSLSGDGRLMGLDVGTKTIGVAISDFLKIAASPATTIQRKKWPNDLAAMQDLMKQHSVQGIIVGWPLNMDGSEGPRCQSVMDFSKNILKSIDTPLCFWDERLSTTAADRFMLEGDLSRSKRSSRIDQIAAAVILQSAVEALRG